MRATRPRQAQPQQRCLHSYGQWTSNPDGVCDRCADVTATRYRVRWADGSETDRYLTASQAAGRGCAICGHARGQTSPPFRNAGWAVTPTGQETPLFAHDDCTDNVPAQADNTAVTVELDRPTATAVLQAIHYRLVNLRHAAEAGGPQRPARLLGARQLEHARLAISQACYGRRMS